MLTGVVLTHNCKKDLVRCLESLEFCDEILVVDDDSIDQTLTLAKKTKAKIISRSLDGDFAAQRNFALSHVKSGWVLFIDPDEVVSKELASEIIQNTRYEIQNTAFYIPRIDYMWGRLLLHGDSGLTKLVRLGKHDAGKWVYPVHEIWKADGPTGEIGLPLLHYPHPTLYLFLSELNFYSSIRAKQFLSEGKTTNLVEIILGPPWRFFENYFLKLGILDGTAGLVHAMCMAFYMFLVAGKLWLMSHSRS